MDCHAIIWPPFDESLQRTLRQRFEESSARRIFRIRPSRDSSTVRNHQHARNWSHASELRSRATIVDVDTTSANSRTREIVKRRKVVPWRAEDVAETEWEGDGWERTRRGQQSTHHHVLHATTTTLHVWITVDDAPPFPTLHLTHHGSLDVPVICSNLFKQFLFLGVEVPQLQFIDRVAVASLPLRFHRCSSWRRWLTCLLFATSGACFCLSRNWKFRSCRLLLGSSSSWTRSLTRPLLCSSSTGVDELVVQVLGGAAGAVPAVVDVPVIMQRRCLATVKVPQIQFIAGLLFATVGVVAVKGVFGLPSTTHNTHNNNHTHKTTTNTHTPPHPTQQQQQQQQQ